MQDDKVNGEVLTLLWSLKLINTNIMVYLPTSVQNKASAPVFMLWGILMVTVTEWISFAAQTPFHPNNMLVFLASIGLKPPTSGPPKFQ